MEKEIIKWEGEYKIIRRLMGEFSPPRKEPRVVERMDVISTLDGSKEMFVTKVDDTGIYGEIIEKSFMGIGMELYNYLRRNRRNEVIDFHLRMDSDTHFYIHPEYQSGETLDIHFPKPKSIE